MSSSAESGGGGIVGSISVIVFVLVCTSLIVRIVVLTCSAMCCCTKKGTKKSTYVAQWIVLLGFTLWILARLTGFSASSIDWKYYTLIFDNFFNTYLWSGSYVLPFFVQNFASVGQILWIACGVLFVAAIGRALYVCMRVVWCCGDACADFVTSTIMIALTILFIIWTIGPIHIFKFMYSPKGVV